MRSMAVPHLTINLTYLAETLTLRDLDYQQNLLQWILLVYNPDHVTLGFLPWAMCHLFSFFV